MRTLLLLILLPVAVATATDVYRWVDDAGQTHYSDQWRPGAERISVEVTRGTSPAPVPADTTSRPSVAAPQPDYQALEIIAPAQEEVLWNIEGQLPVSVQITPPLKAGHVLRLFLDGVEKEIPAGSTATVLTDVFRGVHTLRAEVIDSGGKVLLGSLTRTFAVRQTSLANPQRAPSP